MKYGPNMERKEKSTPQVYILKQHQQNTVPELSENLKVRKEKQHVWLAATKRTIKVWRKRDAMKREKAPSENTHEPEETTDEESDTART